MTRVGMMDVAIASRKGSACTLCGGGFIAGIPCPCGSIPTFDSYFSDDVHAQ